MGFTVSRNTDAKIASRHKKKQRIRKKMLGTTERPRLCVYRSLRYLTAQIIDDLKGITLVAATTQGLQTKSKGNKEAAAELGKTIAQLAKDKKISAVVFDRSGYLYHGKVKAVADAAREAGLQF